MYKYRTNGRRLLGRPLKRLFDMANPGVLRHNLRQIMMNCMLVERVIKKML